MLWIGALGAAAAAGSGVVVARQRPITGLAGCGSGDGLSYCAMARGGLGKWPFSHRPLVPFLARLGHFVTGQSVQHSFLIIAILGFALTLAATAGLGYAVAAAVGLARAQAVRVAFIGAAVWAACPFALRFVFLSPVLTDSLATALTVCWLLTLVRSQSQTRVGAAAPLLALFATLAREVAVALIVAVCLAAVMARFITARRATFSVAASALGFLFDVTRPSRPNAPFVHEAWRSSLKYWLHHPGPLSRALLMGVGLGLVALVPTVVLRLVGAVASPRVLVPLIAGALVTIALSITGLDLARLSSPAVPILSVVLATYLVASGGTLRWAIVVAAATTFLFEWRIFAVIARSHRGYTDFFLGRHAFGTPVLLVLATLVAALALVDAFDLRGCQALTSRTPGGSGEAHASAPREEDPRRNAFDQPP